MISKPQCFFSRLYATETQPSRMPPPLSCRSDLNPSSLHNIQFRRSNVQRIHVCRQARIGLLPAVRPMIRLKSLATSNRPSLWVAQATLQRTYLTSVLILTVSTSYNFFSASLICRLFAFTSQMNTKVLFSSIFFIADSVFRGWMITLWWSRRGSWGTDLRGNLGERESCSVLGR